MCVHLNVIQLLFVFVMKKDKVKSTFKLISWITCVLYKNLKMTEK